MTKKVDHIKIILLLMVVVLLVLNLQPRSPRHPRRNERPDRMFKELRLTPVQLKQLQAHREHKFRFGPDKDPETIMKLHEQLMREAVKDNPDQYKISQLVNELNAFDKERLENMVKDIQELKKILTNEQMEIMFRQGHKKIKKEFSRPPF
jgi:Spy/CpxP family protein refolding chaperone